MKVEKDGIVFEVKPEFASLYLNKGYKEVNEEKPKKTKKK